MTSELELIEWLQRRFPGGATVPLGLTDDAALVRGQPSDSPWLVTTDLLMEGTDFKLTELSARHVGYKALAVNLSDLAAMAARPVAVLVSLALPVDGGAALARELYEGMTPLLDRYRVAMAGGDTNSWPAPLVVCVTAIGLATGPAPLTRSGGMPGDALIVTGQFGGSILGKHYSFEPRVREALTLHHKYDVHAAIDVSDGLALDLHRLAQASECGAEIDVSAIPIAPAAIQLSRKETPARTPLEHALGDGEDFELCCAAPPDEADRIVADQPLSVPVTRIGRLTEEPGLWLVRSDGTRTPLEPSGYRHMLE